MRRSVLFLSLSVFLAALLLMLALPGTYAQTPPPVLQSTRTPVPPGPPPVEDVLVVVHPPFGDTFDTGLGWSADGAWKYDTESALSGTSWHLDGTVRETLSTLEYASLIDLSGALSAQLVFRQKGTLPASDLLAVDLSLDGGLSWFLVDQQIGIATDWDQYIVDLTRFRGQIIKLRFRLQTGAPLWVEDPISPGYWLDNLAIHYVITVPEMVYEPEDLGPRTLMGLHLIMGASSQPVLDLVRRLNDIGWPMGTIKGTTGTEPILNQIAALSPNTIVVYRTLLTPWGMRDCPNTHNDPVIEAQMWTLGLQSYWAEVRADYYEIMNECLPPVEWLVEFSIEAMRVANAYGQCLLLFSFPTGTPEPYEFRQLLPVFEYALQNPCRSGRYHGIALHAYGLAPSTLVSESGIYLGYRYRLYYAEILSELPEAIRIPIYLTEVGAGDGVAEFDCKDITRDVIQYTAQLEYDPYVKGFHLWSLGSGGGNQWVDVTPCLPMIEDALMNYYRWR